jgi:hypothetical protein
LKLGEAALLPPPNQTGRKAGWCSHDYLACS